LRRPELEALAQAHGVAEAVTFLGYRGDVPAIWQRATLGVNCSSSEGLANAVIEGMAASRPMVVTLAGGNPELIADGTRGFVVAPGRPVALARAMVRLAKDTELRRRMGAAGRAYVERHLTHERLARDHDRLYRRMLERRGEDR
jgi:glycosyltransferase involved in cell wall biosynthesis